MLLAGAHRSFQSNTTSKAITLTDPHYLADWVGKDK
jgi:hypothetical protein